ncbi:hypothetical protein VTJ04DRAFT_10251 [Mycothermus thermophilus]|uniref:uncharacterized protein n=1 Tax=Humicola insolens TaxID=85995 RepID=UPI0037448AC2
MPRRKPAASTAGSTPSTTTNPSAAPKTKKYQSTPVPKQVTFPPRRKVVRTYGRRSLPAELETTGGAGSNDEDNDTTSSAGKRRSLRQATLTQIDYVRSFSGSGEEGEIGGLRDDVEDDDEEEEDGEGDVFMKEVKKETKTPAVPATATASKPTRRTSERRSKRRKTDGDAPKLERKGSSFKTQTLTQFLGDRAEGWGELRIDDDDEEEEKKEVKVEDEEQQTKPPRARSAKAAPPKPKRGKGKISDAVAELQPHTPSHKRIKVEVDEVPSSQPTPFTPLNGYSPIPAQRSPLATKSSNLDPASQQPRQTTEAASSNPKREPSTTGKFPRTLVIQDSYSTAGGSSPVVPSSSLPAVTTPVQNRVNAQPQPPAQKIESQRQPLAEIPVSTADIPGVGATPPGETQSARRKRMFVEIPDSDDDLASVMTTTPLGMSGRSLRSRGVAAILETPTARRTQQFQRPRQQSQPQAVEEEGFEIARGGAEGDVVAETPTSGMNVATPGTGKSNKENESPVARAVEEVGEIEVFEEPSEDGQGEATPRVGRVSQLAGERRSQASPNTVSQFWSAPSAEGRESSQKSSAPALRELAVLEEAPTAGPSSPKASQFHGSMGASMGRLRRGTPQLEEDEQTASEAEEDAAGPKETGRGTTQLEGKRTPEPSTESSTSEDMPGTPTPVIRNKVVHIEEPPPPSNTEEVYKETPRQPERRTQKSSPLYPRQTQLRHTQPRSQYFSQRFESQRVPLEVIRSLGPQTDRSDILVAMQPDIVAEIVDGVRIYDFRNYRFPPQVSRCWIYETDPVNEIRYMATLGPAQEPGQIADNTGKGNVEFNAGTSGFQFAHELKQVYVLNNPVPREDMPDNGLGDGPPPRYRYVPPAIVGQLLGNLNRALFVEGEMDEEGQMTVSQELEEQIRCDIIHSTQRRGIRWEVLDEEEEEEDVIPASQSPLKGRKASEMGTLTRSSQQQQQRQLGGGAVGDVRPSQAETQTQTQTQTESGPSLPAVQVQAQAQRPKRRQTPVRPSQATTVSEASSPVNQLSRQKPVSSPVSVITIESSGPRPRPPALPAESSDLLLPRNGLEDAAGKEGGEQQRGETQVHDEEEDEEEDSLGLPIPLPADSGFGSGGGSGARDGSKRGSAGVDPMMMMSSLPPDSLLVREVGMAPPPVEVWDSDSEV